jgi:hypothetical protein
VGEKGEEDSEKKGRYRLGDLLINGIWGNVHHTFKWGSNTRWFLMKIFFGEWNSEFVKELGFLLSRWYATNMLILSRVSFKVRRGAQTGVVGCSDFQYS